MPRSLAILSIVLAAMIAGGAAFVLKPAPAVSQLAEADVRAIVTQMLAERDADAAPLVVSDAAGVDAATLNPMIESYLLDNPGLLEKMANALESERVAAETARTRDAVASMRDAIYNDPADVVLGNPNGDVTLVEMFDYNCSFCRKALPDLVALLAEDPNLKVILKEFPILSDESIAAARIAITVARQPDVDYWAYHQALFSSRGQVTRQAALDAAEAIGLNPMTIALDAEATHVTETLQRSYEVAKALNVDGTPTFIIGDEIIPGAVGIDALRERIANMRKCGSTNCPQPS